MNQDLNELEFENFDYDYDDNEELKSDVEYIEENLWAKVEKLGKKISFAKDIAALYRYMKDSDVSWYRKAIVVGALVYFLIPVDSIPDLAPLVGYLDDLGVITAVIKYMGSEIIPYYRTGF